MRRNRLGKFNKAIEVTVVKQLRLVTDEQGARASAQNAGPSERVFAHWVFMMGKNPLRTRLDMQRRAVLAKALALYDEATLTLAIDGCAGSAWHAGENDRGRPFNDIELILRDARHIEDFAERGELLRREMGLQRAAEARVQTPVDAVSDVEAAAAREALRAFAMHKSGRA